MAKQTLEDLKPPFRYYISIRHFTDIDATEQSILLMLNSRIGNGEYCSMSEDQLAAEAKVNVRTLRRRLPGLSGKGLLSYHRSKGEGRYRFSISRDPIFEAAKAANSRPDKMSAKAANSRPDKMSATPDKMSATDRTKCPLAPDKMSAFKKPKGIEEGLYTERKPGGTSVSVFKGELSYSVIKNPDNDPVSLAMRLCEVEDLAEREAKKYKDAGKKEAEKAAVLLRNWNTFQKQLRLKGEVVFRNALEKAFGEKLQGEWDSVENPASLFTERLGKYPDKADGPRPSRPPAIRTETDKPTPTDLEAQTASLAKSLFKHPGQANGSQAEAKGFIAELLSYAEKNGITDADPDGSYAIVLSELFKLGCGEALNKLPTRAKYAFACLWMDADENGRRDLIAKLDEVNQKSTPQCADADIDGEIPF